ncbi:hypothetical protein QYS62_006221 [Fusarium acuminatum]|nr:unnamed protein product [Fusarium acuminatum CS5907]
MDEGSNHQHFLQRKTIIVAGGGIAGSAFVVGLRKLWSPRLEEPRIVIYDRDSPDVSAQREGYTVSLAGYDTSGGLIALNKLGLLKQTLNKAVSGLNNEGAFKIWGPNWNEQACFRHKPLDGLPSSSIRITRKDLRQVLQDNLRLEDSVQWNSRCIAVRQLKNGQLSVQVVRGKPGFEVISEEICDILIAADGANSKLREYLRPSDKLEFAGAILRGGISRFEGPPPTPVDKDWGFMLSGTGVSCFFSPVDKQSIVWGVGTLETEQIPSLDENDDEAKQEVIECCRRLGAILHEPFNTILRHTDLKTVFSMNAHDKMPFSHEDMIKEGVVFIGDSNHAVSPFAGYGANLALSDAWDLAEQFCSSSSMEYAIAAYDGLSLPRARKVLESSRERLKIGHRKGIEL